MTLISNMGLQYNDGLLLDNRQTSSSLVGALNAGLIDPIIFTSFTNLLTDADL